MRSIISLTIVLILIVGCTAPVTTQTQQTESIKSLPDTMATILPTTTIKPRDTATLTTVPQATATVPMVTEEPAPLPLSEPGPYHMGERRYKFVDTNRDSREVNITVWYPAVLPADSTSSGSSRDADPDPSGAPYPTILSSTKVARIFASYLVSHGFVWVSVDRIDTYPLMKEQMFEQPLDILFALDEVASNAPEGLDGMIDAGHAETIGYSFDGYNSLAMSGARINPEFYLAQCADPDATTEAVLSALSSFNCEPAHEWDEFTALVDEAISASEDGLWQPMTDARIRAVMPLAGEGWSGCVPQAAAGIGCADHHAHCPRGGDGSLDRPGARGR